MWGSEADRVKLLQQLAADRVLRNYDGLGRKRSGELFPNLFSAEIVTLKGRECLICVVHDLTVQKRAEALVTAQMQVLEMIAAGKPMKETLEALLKFMQVQSPDLLCSILLLDQESKRLHHGAATALPEEFIRAVDGVAIGPSVGSCGTAAFRREPVFVADIAHDPLWSMTKELALPHGLLACWSTPIFDARQQVLGTFAIYRRTVGLPDEAQLQMIEMATHTAAVCIGRHRSETERAEALIREQQARVQYTFQLIASQEAERKRIAAELHDSMGQNLLLIKNLAQMAARSQEPALVYEQVATISQLATQCIAEARQISRELHPHQLDHLGLQRALEVMLETAASASSVIFSWKIEDTGDIFSAEAKMNLYRIVQESLSNSLKHSNAQHIRVRLERDVHEVVLEFADDGCGFDPAVQTSSKSGMGLKNITERARMLGGRLKLDAAPGRGARLEISIPVADTIE
jgi:signal transduction histidine kinase